MSSFNNYNLSSAPSFYVVAIPGNTGGTANGQSLLASPANTGLQTGSSSLSGGNALSGQNLLGSLFSLMEMMLEMFASGGGASASSASAASSSSSSNSSVAQSLAKYNLAQISDYYNEPDPTLKNVDQPPPPPPPDDGGDDDE